MRRSLRKRRVFDFVPSYLNPTYKCKNEACAHYIMVSKFQWKPFWLATQRDWQNDWTATQNRVNYHVFAQAPLAVLWQNHKLKNPWRRTVELIRFVTVSLDCSASGRQSDRYRFLGVALEQRIGTGMCLLSELHRHALLLWMGVHTQYTQRHATYPERYYPGQKKLTIMNMHKPESCDVEESAAWFPGNEAMREVASCLCSRFRRSVKQLDFSLSQDFDSWWASFFFFFFVQGSMLVLLAVTSWCSNDALFTCVISEYWRHRTRVCQFRHILLSDWESSWPVCGALLLLFVPPCEVFRASYAYWTSTQEHSAPWFVVKLTFHYEDAGQAVGWTWCVTECQHKHRRLTTVPLRLVPPWSSRISELLLITVQWLLQVKCTLLSVIHLPPDTVESAPRLLHTHPLAQPRISRHFHENLGWLISINFPYLSWFVSSNNQTRTIEAFLYLMT